MEQEWLVLLTVSVVEAADLAAMSSFFQVLEKEFQVGPASLGWLSFVQAVAIKFSVIFWGPQVDKHKDPGFFFKVSLIGFGLFSFLTSLSTEFYHLLACRFGAACFSALVRPLSGTIITKHNTEESRGRFFGWFRVSQAVGSMSGTYFGARYSATWRQLMACFSIASVLLCATLELICFPTSSNTLSYLFSNQYHPVPTSTKPGSIAGRSKVGQELGSVQRVFRTRSFQLIMIHGIFGSFPYSGFGFLVLWFQSSGVSNGTAGMFANCLHFGTVFGHIIAGYLGDYAASLSPDHGRIYVAQAADFFRIPMTFLVFGFLKHPNAQALALFLLGLVIPWVGSGAISPMLTELAPPEIVGSVSGYHLALESVFAVLAGPVVGMLAEKSFGYSVKNLAACGDGKSECHQAKNHEAIGQALLYNTAVPWIICSVIISFLHLYFPHNRFKNSSARRI